MFIVNPDDYASDSFVRVLICEDNEILASVTMNWDEAFMRFLELLGSPRPVVVSRQARTLMASSAVYVGDDNKGIWFVGLNVKDMLTDVEIFRVLSQSLEVRWCDDEGEPILDDPNTTPFVHLGQMLYGDDGQLLTIEEARELEAKYAHLLDRFIQFYVWVQSGFAQRQSMRPQELLDESRWLTVERALKWASLDGWQKRSQFIYRTKVRIWES